EYSNVRVHSRAQSRDKTAAEKIIRSTVLTPTNLLFDCVLTVIKFGNLINGLFSQVLQCNIHLRSLAILGSAQHLLTTNPLDARH
ncbi:8119_t:CDS:1, partial [Acaulospora morrowiae]